MKSSNSNSPTVIDLFAGCGGLSLGLEQAGFFPLFVSELNSDARETYLLNRDERFPHLRDRFNAADIKECVGDPNFFTNLWAELSSHFSANYERGSVDLVVGGPPCQGFSGIGLRRSYSVDKKQLPSNHLFQDMAFFIHNVRPKMFLFENVQGLLRARWTSAGDKGEIFRDVLKTFQELEGYNVRYSLVHAKQFGVPQNRPRVLLVGVRSDIALPRSTNIDAIESGFLPSGDDDFHDLEDVLGDLCDPNFEYGGATKQYTQSAETEAAKYYRTRPDGSIMRRGSRLTEQEYSKHSQKVRDKFSYMIENGGQIPAHFQTKKFAQRLMPRRWSVQGPTITATSLPDDFVHFSQARTPTVREWARLQTFPDWYEFAGKRTTGGLRRAGNPRENIHEREVPKYTQIGNAVPVKMAYEVGKHFRKILDL